MRRTPLFAPAAGAGASEVSPAPFLTVPSETPPTSDSNTILDGDIALEASGGWMTLAVDALAADWVDDPEAEGCYWDVGLIDTAGNALASANLRGCVGLELEVDGLLPANVGVFACHRADTLAASTRSYGVAIVGTGAVNNGERIDRVGGGWSTDAIVGSAAVRKANPYLGMFGHHQIRAFSATLYEDDRSEVAESVSAPLTNMAGFDFVGASFGVFVTTALAVSGSVRFRVKALYASESQIWGAP